MVVRDVKLQFNAMVGLAGVVVVLSAASLIVNAIMWHDYRWTGMDYFSVFLAYFVLNLLTLGKIHKWLVRLIVRKFDSDPLLAFPRMYGELFAHRPVQIDYRLDVDNYLNAICYDGEFLYVIEKNKMAALKWSDVRQWEWAIHTPEKQTTIGSTPGLAFQGMVNDAIANAGPALKAITNSGIRLTVKDINHPQWLYNTGIDSKAETTCRKWEEIFRQFSDGSLKIAA